MVVSLVACICRAAVSAVKYTLCPFCKWTTSCISRVPFMGEKPKDMPADFISTEQLHHEHFVAFEDQTGQHQTPYWLIDF